MFTNEIVNPEMQRNRQLVRFEVFAVSERLMQEAFPPDKRPPKVVSLYLQGYFVGVVRALPPYVSQEKHEVTVVNEFALALRKILEKAKFTDVQGKILDRLKELDREAQPSPAPAAPDITAT
jgi:hypothetical protein